MSTVQNNGKTKTATLMRSNPILNRLSKVTERDASNTATYAGIAAKTSFFLAATLVGMIIQLIVKTAMAGEPVWQTITMYEKFTFTLTMKETVILGVVLLAGFAFEMLGIFIRRTVPVTGTLYALSQGYVISFLVFKVLVGYEYLGLEALLLTVAVVAAMSWLYSAGIIKVDRKFRMVLMSLLIGSVGVGVLTFIGSLIPSVRPYVNMMMNNFGISIAFDIVGLVIAALFLISDFSMVDNCVQEGYPKEYEWYAAFGLVFTVIWIYLKILDLLIVTFLPFVSSTVMSSLTGVIGGATSMNRSFTHP